MARFRDTRLGAGSATNPWVVRLLDGDGEVVRYRFTARNGAATVQFKDAAGDVGSPIPVASGQTVEADPTDLSGDGKVDLVVTFDATGFRAFSFIEADVETLSSEKVDRVPFWSPREVRGHVDTVASPLQSAIGGASGIVRPSALEGGNVNVALLIDRIYWCGIVDLRDAETLTALSVEVGVAGDGAAVVRLGTAMVSDNGVVVGQTLTEHGSVDATTTGMKTISAIGAAVGPGRLALFALTNGETATAPQVRACAPNFDRVALGSALWACRMVTPLSASSYAAGMPATVPAIQTSVNLGPALAVEFS